MVDDLAINAGELLWVDGVSLNINAGEAVAFVGESGLGKSVTILSIMGLLADRLSVECGRNSLSGQELVGLSNDALRQMRGADIAMIFQENCRNVSRAGDGGGAYRSGFFLYCSYLHRSSAISHSLARSFTARYAQANYT